MAHSLTDGQIADALNAQGLQTVKGRAWSARRVMDFRLSNAIPSGFTANPQLRLTDNGYLTTAEAAARLEINQTTVQKWYKLGLLQGKHASSQKALWIAWTQEVVSIAAKKKSTYTLYFAGLIESQNFRLALHISRVTLEEIPGVVVQL